MKHYVEDKASWTRNNMLLGPENSKVQNAEANKESPTTTRADLGKKAKQEEHTTEDKGRQQIICTQDNKGRGNRWER